MPGIKDHAGQYSDTLNLPQPLQCALGMDFGTSLVLTSIQSAFGSFPSITPSKHMIHQDAVPMDVGKSQARGFFRVYVIVIHPHNLVP